MRKFAKVFFNFSMDIVSSNVENVQQGTNLLSNSLLRKDNCCFANEKDLIVTLKRTKHPKIFRFLPFLLNFCQTIDIRHEPEC